MTNIYESRFNYMYSFVGGKVFEEYDEYTDDDVRKTVYSTIAKSLKEMHLELSTEHPDEYRFAMWAMVAAAYGASESFLAVNMEVANLALDVAEELAAIATTYHPKDYV